MTAKDPAHEPELPPAPKPMRLQRFLSQCGLGSRRDCEELITAGRVTIDGVIADQLGTSVNPSTQTVTLDGERLKVQRKKYFMLNKPSGYLCTADDPEGRRLVLDLFPEEGPRLFTVGRLDENTTGLLVVTNDGDLAQKLAHPRYRIFRTYEAQVAGQPRPEVYEQLRQGLFFTEGKFRVYSVKPIKKQKDSTWVEIVMTEGQNREIRRLFARVGHKIMKLERQGYGPLRLGRLNKGEYRELTREELASLHAVLERNRAEEGDKAPPRGRPAGKPFSPRSGKPERSSRPERTGRPERGERSGRPERSGPSGERGRPERRRRDEFGDKADRGTSFERGSRPPRPDGQRGDRPYGDKPRGDRPDRDRTRGEGSREDRPRRDRPYGDRPRGERPSGDRPREDRPRGDRPYGDRPHGERPSGDRPYGDKPRGERPFGDRPRGDRPSRGEGGPRRDRPDREEGSSDTRRSRPGRPSGRPSDGSRTFERSDRREQRSEKRPGSERRTGGERSSGGERKSAFGERRGKHVPGNPSARRPAKKSGKRRPPQR